MFLWLPAPVHERRALPKETQKGRRRALLLHPAPATLPIVVYVGKVKAKLSNTKESSESVSRPKASSGRTRTLLYDFQAIVSVNHGVLSPLPPPLFDEPATTLQNLLPPELLSLCLSLEQNKFDQVICISFLMNFSLTALSKIRF